MPENCKILNRFMIFLCLVYLISCKSDPLKIIYQPHEIQITEVTYAKVKRSNPLAINAKELGINSDAINNLLNTKLGDISLTAKIYTPPVQAGPTKAVIIFHGGAFIPGMGSKGDFNIHATCMHFAQRGIAAIAAEYRLMNILTPSFYKAGFVATQDGKAVVRYIANHSGEYNINPEDLYLMGYSAGAVTALHSAFLDQHEDINGRSDKLNAIYGHLDGVGEQVQIPYVIKGVINIAGGIFDTSILDNDIRILSFHGDQDDIISLDCDLPFKENSKLYNKLMNKGKSILNSFDYAEKLLEEAKFFKVCGSRAIDRYIATNAGKHQSKLKVLKGAGHIFVFSQNGIFTKEGSEAMVDIILFVNDL